MNMMVNTYMLYPCLRSVFGCVCLAELVACFKEKDGLRRVLKPFCLFLLFLIAVILFPNQPYLYLGLFCGRLGDIFRRFTKKNFSIFLGMCFFFLNHLFFILEFATLFSTEITSRAFLIYGVGTGLVFSFAAYSIHRKLRIPWQLKLGGAFYASILVLDLAVRCLGLYLGHSEFVFGVIGGVFFLISDLFLTYSRYLKEVKRDHFYIRLTYLFAERMIFLSFSSTLGAF